MELRSWISRLNKQVNLSGTITLTDKEADELVSFLEALGSVFTDRLSKAFDATIKAEAQAAGMQMQWEAFPLPQIRAEMLRQLDKWGEQNHPIVMDKEPLLSTGCLRVFEDRAV